MRWKVNRKNVDGKHLCYFLKQAKVIIIDYGYEDGDIASRSHLEIKELKDDNSLYKKIFRYKSKQNKIHKRDMFCNSNKINLFHFGELQKKVQRSKKNYKKLQKKVQ